MNNIYNENIKLLKKFHGEKFIEFIDSYTEQQDIILEMSKENSYSLKIKKNNNERYITSKYAPLKQAKRFVGDVDDYDEKTLFIVYGMGTTYHISELIKILGEDNNIIAIEPSTEVFKKVLESIDISELLRSEKVHFCIGENLDNIIQSFSDYLNVYNVKNFKFLVFSQYDKIYDDFYIKCLEELRNSSNECKILINTINHFSNEFIKNLFNNLDYVSKEYEIQILRNRMKGIPAIIVSAGPSLDKNIKHLKKAQNKALIIAGGRTLNALLENNIIPDIVVSIDPGEGAYQVIKDNLNREALMITTVVSNYKVINRYKGNKVFINNSQYKDFIKNIINKDIEIIEQGGSVANTSLSIANYMGCNPMVLVGQDLAYTDGKYHAENSKDKEGNNKVIDVYLEIEDIYGDKVFTDETLLSFLKWFEKYIESIPNKLVIDATEGGAKIKGTEITTLKESINKYCKNDANIKNIIDNIFNKYNSNLKKSYNTKSVLKDLKNDIFEIKQKSEKAILDIREIEKNSLVEGIEKNNIDLLNNLYKKAVDYINSSILVYTLMSPILLKIEIDNSFNYKNTDTKEKRLLKLIKKCKSIYEEIYYMSNRIYCLINDIY